MYLSILRTHPNNGIIATFAKKTPVNYQFLIIHMISLVQVRYKQECPCVHV